jgi:hypothetical protein
LLALSDLQPSDSLSFLIPRNFSVQEGACAARLCNQIARAIP